MGMTMKACWNCHTPLKDNTMVSDITGSEFCLTCCCLVKDNVRPRLAKAPLEAVASKAGQGGQDGSDIETERAACNCPGDAR
jgi:hypothetical protein